MAFVNQKGGCAKSTTAVHYAPKLVEQGKQVSVGRRCRCSAL
ncbi:division plane positioning ATPase MipZ [Microcoleus sp. herbarium2]